MENMKETITTEEFSGYFNNYKFYINPETNEIEIKFVCEDCKKIMTRDEMLKGGYQMRASGPNGFLEYHTAQFRCRECAINKMGNSNENNVCTCEECSNQRINIKNLRRVRTNKPSEENNNE